MDTLLGVAAEDQGELQRQAAAVGGHLVLWQGSVAEHVDVALAVPYQE